MAMKRIFDEDDDQEQHRAKIQKVVKYMMQELVTKLEPMLQRVVKNELQPILSLLRSSPSSSLVDQPNPSATRALQLVFVNKPLSVIFTNNKIEAEGNEFIQLKLINADTKSAITNPPFASIKVEIVALSGDFAADGRDDWSEDEFNDCIVREREGKRPLLVGEVSFPLVDGVGVISNLSFTDNSSWVRSRKFRLGIRAVSCAFQGAGIKEAVSDSFVVLDHRGESYKKHGTPALEDPVWRLKRIAKDGAFHKRLAEKGINTVQDFVRMYHVNPQLLRNILGNNVPNKAWELITEHVNACQINNQQLYQYWNLEKGVGLLFNCVYRVIEATFDGHNYIPVDTLNMSQMADVEESKHHAYEDLSKLVPVDISWASGLSGIPAMHDIAPFSCPPLSLPPNDVRIRDQGEPNFCSSDALPDLSYLMDREIQPQEDYVVQTLQPVQIGYPTTSTLEMEDLPARQFTGGCCGWTSRDSATSIFQGSLYMGEEFYPFQTPAHPGIGDWGQGRDVFATCSHDGRIAAIHISGRGRTKSAWCKIRAALKWKTAKRNAAARRKAKSPFYYQ